MVYNRYLQLVEGCTIPLYMPRKAKLDLITLINTKPAKLRISLSVQSAHGFPLPKHAYSNILKISPKKTENFQIKTSDIFHISAQNIDCGYSLEPPGKAVLTSTHNLCF